MYKIEVFIPETKLQSLRNVLLEFDAGHIGNYRGCLSYSLVTGVWFSGKDSNPYVGTAGTWSQGSELKVEFNVEDSLKDAIIQKIKEIHPYEEPVINAIHLT